MAAADHRRAQPARSRRHARAGFAYEGIGRPARRSSRCRRRRARDEASELVEAIILAGGKAERLGDAARGCRRRSCRSRGIRSPSTRSRSSSVPASTRVIVSCAAGQRASSREALRPRREIVAVGEPEPLGRGGGLRFAAQQRQETGPLYALNGDELLDVDLAALLAAHEDRGRGHHRRRAARLAVRRRRPRRRRPHHRLPRGAAARALGQHRPLRARRGSARAAARAGRPRAVDLPRARGRGKLSHSATRALDHREHAQGPPPRRGALRGASRVAAAAPRSG